MRISGLLVFMWIWALTSACGCHSSGAADGGQDASVTTGARGSVYYTLDGRIFRVFAEAGAVPVNVSAQLDAVSARGRDRFAVPSADGAWVAFSSERFGCGGECLMRMGSNSVAPTVVLAGGSEVYVEGIPAITNDGATIVFSAGDGPHDVDLFATRFDGAAWSAPVLLTASSTYAYNNMPALTPDGGRVLFDCSPNPYPEDGANDSCAVNTDGSGFERLLGADALPGARYDKLQNPHPSPDGWLVEATWPVDSDTPEIVWLVPTGGGAPQPIGSAFHNSVSPCSFTDGRFVMLWLGREGNPDGKHELILVDRSGALITVLTPGVDVDDIGIGCGG